MKSFHPLTGQHFGQDPDLTGTHRGKHDGRGLRLLWPFLTGLVTRRRG